MPLSVFEFASPYHWITVQIQNYWEATQPSMREVIQGLKYQDKSNNFFENNYFLQCDFIHCDFFLRPL